MTQEQETSRVYERKTVKKVILQAVANSQDDALMNEILAVLFDKRAGLVETALGVMFCYNKNCDPLGEEIIKMVKGEEK